MSLEIKVTLNISGEKFSPELFNKTLPKYLKGQIKEIKRSTDVPAKEYWFCETNVPIDVHPENALCDLVETYSKYLDHLDSMFDGLTKYASIVASFKSLDQVRGFFISRSLIELCSSKGFEIDIDLYG